MLRNRWPVKIGMGGRFVLEWVAGMVRNTQAIKVTSHFLLYTAHLRFHQLQRLLRYLRARARMVKTRLKYHWEELSGLEQVLAVVAALPLVVILSVLMLVFVVPKALVAFIGGKIKEHSGAAVLKQMAELGVGEKLDTAEQNIKEKIRKKIPLGKQQGSGGAEVKGKE